MSRNFNPTSPLLRTVFATAALLAMLATGGSIAGLAKHYSIQPQIASAQSTVVAQR